MNEELFYPVLGLLYRGISSLFFSLTAALFFSPHKNFFAQNLSL
jgi:hypothetical protein